MGRTRLNRVIAQLRKEIELCEKNKKKLLDYVNQIKNKCLDREINYFEYEQLINQKLDGKTIQEWLDSYDTHIKKREKKIKKEIRKFKANKILLIFSSLILISFIIFSAIYLRPIIVGLITQTPEESQPLSSETQEEAPQPSPSQDIKEPLPSETQPEQIEIPPSSEIPPAETPTTPIEENITQPETNITVPENITAPTNITVPEIPKNITLPEINLTNIAIENITEQNITEANATIITTQYQAKIGQPVKWKKTIILEEPKTIKVKLPKQAENITVNKITEAQKEKKKSDSEITQEAPQQSPSQDIEEPLPSENPPANISETESINETQLSEINKTEELETSTEPISPPENNLNEQIEEPIKEKAKATITGGITGQAISEQETGKSIFQLIIDFFRKVFAGITGRAIITEEKAEEIEVTINDNATEYEILYETPAPQVYEEETEKGKRITISGPDELHYENVLAFTYLTKETPEQKVKLYWVRQENLSFINEETNKTITEKRETKEEINITKYDTNNNSLIDYIEWQVESLSNQTYDLIIEISKAEHLDENRSFISDIYEQVKALDGNWSEPINNNEYVRVTFNKNLTNKNDITIYARASNYSNNSEECYDNETEILTENGWKLFSELDKEKEKVATFNNKTEKLEWQLPYRYQEFEHNGEMYKIELEDGSKLVVSPEHKVYSKNNYLMPNISNNCLGGNTLTKDCSFSFLSPENIGQSSFNASAKYGESLKLILIASGNLSKNSEEGINSTCSLIKEIISDNSSLDNSVSSSILSNLFLISVNRNSGATNSNLFITLFASKTLKGLPFLINEENTTLTSITNNIVYPSFSSFSYLLANAKSVSSDNSSACSWVNLDLSTIDLIFDNLSNFSFNIFPIANCQFILNIEANSSNSSGMSIFACTINKNNTNDYLNFSIRNKGLSDFKLQKITDVYKNINENNKDVYFLDEDNKPIKIKNITKQPYSGKIYDVDVENDIVLVRRKNDNKEINEPLSNLTSNSTAITSASFAALNNLNNNSFNNNYKNNENKEKDANDVASKAMQILADYNILNDNNYINISVETSHNSDILNNINNENKNENKEENNYSYLILTSGLDSNNDNIPEISSFVPEKASVVTAPDSVLRTTTAATFMTPSSVSLNPNLTVMTYFTIDNQNDLSYLNISVVNELNNNLTANNEDLIANENSDLDNSINIENNELINNFDNENNNSNKLINNFDKDSNISEQEASQYSPADDESKSSEKDEFGTAVWSGNSNPASIEVYRENDNISIAKFENITSENYYKIYLTNLSENESYDIFDLKVLGGSVEFDYIVDPTITESQVITQSNLVNVTAETGKSNFTHLTINNLSTNAPYDSLVGYWNFDGDLENTALTTHYDFSRYNNDGTGVGDVTVNTTNCIYDDCARFDGAEDFIDNNNVNLANKNYTVMAWINMKNNLAWNGILSNPTWGRFIFKINDSAVFLYHRSPNTGGVIGTSTFNNNQWYHIVGVFNNKTGMEAYSNGVSIGSVSTASSSGNLAGVHVIGVSNNTLSGGSVYFNGTLDEIMVFNISLTSAQILAIYNNQSARFYSTGTQDVPNINISTLGTENRVNITLYDCDALFNSNLSGQIGIADGSGAYNYNGSIVNFSSCIANNLTIEGNPNNVSLRITFLAGNSTNPFYSPLVIGNITLDSWYEAPAGGDTIYPDFSEYYDDNASLLDTGTGHFNVTVKNTNGTVILHINNTDIYATNLSADYYNVSYAFSSAGTYQYNWTAYGNGTSHNLNTSAERYYTVNLSQAPQITFVFNNSITDLSSSGPNEAPSSTSVIINFSAYDADGDLNHSSAAVNFTKTNEETRQNISCSMYESDVNYANYTCNVTMWWWDGAGTWNIGVFIKDNQNNLAANTSTTFTMGERTSFVISPAVLTWPGIAPGATNQTSNNDPLLLNNTGNDVIDATGITVNSSNLRGETTSTEALWASNFSIDWKTGGSCTGADCVECAGTVMARNAYTPITTANLTKGNFTKNDGTGQEELYFCLRIIGSELSNQAYSTANQTEWPWVVRILLVVLTIKKTNKLKKKKKSGQKNIGELSIPSTIFSNKLGALEAITKYMKENLGMSYHKIAEILNRDQRTIWTSYHQSIKKQEEKIQVKETNIFLPVSIFNKKLTILEAMIIYLKEQGLRYTEIAKLLDRDQRNIWTIYSKAIRKRKEKKKVKDKNITNINIPSTIFSNKLGALEAITKYMKENLGMSYHKIAEILNRDDRTIWTAYNKAKEKQRELIIVKETNIFLPVSIFNKKLTILEAMIVYLKEQGLRYTEIAKLLDRDQRNIWTIYSKAVKK